MGNKQTELLFIGPFTPIKTNKLEFTLIIGPYIPYKTNYKPRTDLNVHLKGEEVDPLPVAAIECEDVPVLADLCAPTQRDDVQE